MHILLPLAGGALVAGLVWALTPAESAPTVSPGPAPAPAPAPFPGATRGPAAAPEIIAAPAGASSPTLPVAAPAVVYAGGGGISAAPPPSAPPPPPPAPFVATTPTYKPTGAGWDPPGEPPGTNYAANIYGGWGVAPTGAYPAPIVEARYLAGSSDGSTVSNLRWDAPPTIVQPSLNDWDAFQARRYGGAPDKAQTTGQGWNPPGEPPGTNYPGNIYGGWGVLFTGRYPAPIVEARSLGGDSNGATQPGIHWGSAPTIAQPGLSDWDAFQARRASAGAPTL